MDPVVQLRGDELSDGHWLVLFILHESFSNIPLLRFLLLLIELVEADGGHLGAGADPGDLCAEIVGLGSGEFWKGDNLQLFKYQITIIITSFCFIVQFIF